MDIAAARQPAARQPVARLPAARLPRRLRGAAIVEYVVVTAAALGALLMPLGGDDRSVLRRLIEAVQQEHAGYLYAASVAALPRGQASSDAVPPGGGDGSGSGGSGGADGDGTPPDDADGTGAGDGAGSDHDGSQGSGDAGDGGTVDIGGGAPPGDGGLDDPDGSGIPGDGNGGEPDQWVDGGADGPLLGDSGCPAPGTDPSAGTDGFAAAQPSQTMAMHVGNPIHVVTGNKYQREPDFSVAALGVAFVRHYNSRSAYAGVLGKGWRHAFEAGLSDGGDTIRLWQADGRRIDFAQTARRGAVRRFRPLRHDDGRLVADASGYEWYWHDGRVLSFDRDRVLRRVRDAAGRVLHLVRDPEHRLVALHGGSPDRSVRLIYDRQGRLVAASTPEGRRTTYAYDGQGNLARVGRPDGSERRYHYEDPVDAHNLTGISVAPGPEAVGTRVRTWRYDPADRGISSQTEDPAASLALSFAPDATRVTGADGRASVYHHTRVSGLAVVSRIEGPGCDPCSRASGGAMQYRYNEALQLTELGRADGSALRYDYDAQRRLISVSMRSSAGTWTEVAGIRYRADSGQVSELRRPSVRPGHVRRLVVEHDARQRPVRVTEQGFAPADAGGWTPISRTQNVAFDARGRLAWVDGWREGDADRTGLQWRADGATRTEFPDGGFLVLLAPDAAGRATRIQTEAGDPIDLGYDEDGRLATARRGGRVLHFDAVRREENRPGAASGARFADWPDLAAAAHPEAMRAYVDASGHLTRHGYDDFGRRVREDSVDRGTRRYVYTGDSMLSALTDANGHHVRFERDAGGRIVRSIVGGADTHYVWRGAGAATRLERIVATDHGETLDYDDAGRLLRRQVSLDAARYVTRHHYDGRGRRVGTILPDGRALTWRYHADGRLFSIGQLHGGKERPLIVGLGDESPDARSAGIRDWTFFNGLSTSHTRRDGRLVELRIGDLHRFTYRYADAAAGAKIVAIDDHGRPEQRFRYDARGRLDFALTPQALYGFDYDANGTPRRLTINGQHVDLTAEHGSNRLLHVRTGTPPWHVPLRASRAMLPAQVPAPMVPSADMAHLNGGEATVVGALRVEWNANGQPGRLWRGGSLLAEYRYNARAERIAKIVYGSATGAPHPDARDAAHAGSTRYLYEDGRLSAEIAADGRIARQYLYLHRKPVVILEGADTYAVHGNHLGAPIAVTDESRRVVWRARYAPFGAAQVSEDPDGDGKTFVLNLRFPGQYADAESGLHYNHHRYYDPYTGRYLSPDPLGLYAGANPYAYANNDPVNFVDPTGLLLFAFDGTGNNDPPEEKQDLSNVVKLRDSYLGTQGELSTMGPDRQPSGRHHFYISGPGTLDSRSGIGGAFPDAGTGESMPDRIARMADDFFDHAAWLYVNRQSGITLDVDIVGFSRGAASARVFANLLGAFLDGEASFVLDRESGRRVDFTVGDPRFARDYFKSACVNVGLRFLGLWDTVPHYRVSQDDDLAQLDLAIHPDVKHVAHAVAVNEDREDFHGVSIHKNPMPTAGMTSLPAGANLNTESRMELGFIGAHSDIGGGYSEGDLSDVAFMWMVQRAERAGVAIDRTYISATKRAWDRANAPAVHDSVGVWPTRFPYRFSAGREFKYLNDIDKSSQKDWSGYGMDYSLSQKDFYDRRYVSDGEKQQDYSGDRTLVGIVDGNKYRRWLKDNYDLAIEVNDREILPNGLPPPAQK